jgi:two-component system CheB/CheR fusion protein
VARIASGKIRLQREPVEVGQLVRAAIEDHRTSFVERGLTLDARLSPDLLWVEADAARLTQVLGNLLGNALKFTPAGGRVEIILEREESGADDRNRWHGATSSVWRKAAKAWTGPDEDESMWGAADEAAWDGAHEKASGAAAENKLGSAIIRVCDTGVGIAPEMLAHLFEPFTQAPQALDRSAGGLGLGLAMVRALVEQHKGSVTALSDGIGRGAEMVVRLPLAVVKPTPRATLPPPAGQHTILVIEDNTDLRDGLKTLLEMFGHHVVAAEEGYSAIELARINRPSLVLCDIGLPGMSGYEVAQLMRQDPALHNVYLVALSGYARPEDRKMSSQAGFNEHISKPPSVERLKRLLAEAPTFAGA